MVVSRQSFDCRHLVVLGLVALACNSAGSPTPDVDEPRGNDAGERSSEAGRASVGGGTSVAGSGGTSNGGAGRGGSTSGGTSGSGARSGSGAQEGGDAGHDGEAGSGADVNDGGRPSGGGGSGDAGRGSGDGGRGGGAAGSGGKSGTAGAPSGGGPMDLPTDDAGFTEFKPSSDTRRIYVSTSGSDSNDGLSEDSPVASISKGISLLRDGYPDWLLFKRGDVFSGSLGLWKKSGRSPSEPMVIGAYGDLSEPRPVFNTGTGPGIQTNGGGGSPEVMRNLAFVSLYFHANRRDPSQGSPESGGEAGIQWLRGGENILVEDCVFEHYSVGMVWQEYQSVISNVRIYRTLILDSWSNNRPQGIYMEGVEGFVLEESILDRNGWSPFVSNSVPDIFSHNIYIQTSNAGDPVLKNNIIMRGASHGAQMRSGGTAEGNVFVENAIALLLGGGNEPVPGGVTANIRDNVVLEGVDILPRQGHQNREDIPRGWAIDLANIKTARVENNIVAHCRGSMCATISQDRNATYANNVIWDWPAGGRLGETPGPFVNPEATIGSYNAELGGAATVEAFAQELRKQRKGNWRTDLTAQRVREYFRAAFTKR